MAQKAVILITEDSLSQLVVNQMLAQTGCACEVVNTLTWNKDKIKSKIQAINQSARGQAYIVLTDQDTPDRCPPTAIQEIPEALHANLLYRFAVMEVESWIMAHREAFAHFLSIPINRIPIDTDTLPDPKAELIRFAKMSRSSSIRADIAPAVNSNSEVGPDYNGRISEFIMAKWQAKAAARHSPSLTRALHRLEIFCGA